MNLLEIHKILIFKKYQYFMNLLLDKLDKMDKNISHLTLIIISG